MFNIMIVEDDANQRKLMATVLEQYGYNVIQAVDGIDALAAYESLKPYIKYFHIKDSLSAGAIVPPGCGEANIREILERHAMYSALPFFVTLEPHLETFDGLNKLVGKAFDNPYKFESARAAFETALDDLEQIVASVG